MELLFPKQIPNANFIYSEDKMCRKFNEHSHYLQTISKIKQLIQNFVNSREKNSVGHVSIKCGVSSLKDNIWGHRNIQKIPHTCYFISWCCIAAHKEYKKPHPSESTQAIKVAE